VAGVEIGVGLFVNIMAGGRGGLWLISRASNPKIEVDSPPVIAPGSGIRAEACVPPRMLVCCSVCRKMGVPLLYSGIVDFGSRKW